MCQRETQRGIERDRRHTERQRKTEKDRERQRKTEKDRDTTQTQAHTCD